MKLYGFFRITAAPFIRALYRLRVQGAQHIPKSGGVILCSNHRSVADPILLGFSVKRRQVRYMAKQELFENHGQFAAWFLRTLGAFPVNRGKGDTQAIEQAVSILEQGGMLGIFPQGYVTPPGVPFAPKSGVATIAYRAKAPVLPAAILADGKIKPFGPVTVSFGKLIAYEDFGFTTGSRSEIKAAAHKIADAVNQLLEDA